MKFMIENFDFYGSEFKINVQGKSKMSTTIGFVTSIISVILILISCCFFFRGLFDRSNFTIIYNENENKIPITNISNTPILISVFSNRGLHIIPNSTYELQSILTKYEMKEDASSKKKMTLSNSKINLEKCNSTHIIGYEKYFENINVSNYYCIPPNLYNNTLYGRYADLVNGFSFLNIYMSKCDKTKSKCDPDQLINSKLEQAFLTVAYLSYQIDHYNFRNPGEMKLETSAFLLSYNIVRRYSYYLDHVQYFSDNGLLNESIQKYNFYKFSSSDVDYDFMIGSNNLINNSYYSVISIKNSSKIIQYNRLYLKFQLVIANIGGIIKLIMTVTELVVFYITKNLHSQNLSNLVFHFNEKEKLVSRIKVPNFTINNQKVDFPCHQNENYLYLILILEHLKNKNKSNSKLGKYWLDSFVLRKMKN
jgi:hypothetical protein